MLKEKQPLKNTFMVLLNAKIHFLWFEMIRVSNYNSSQIVAPNQARRTDSKAEIRKKITCI